jgi:YHS domain-containing protein
MTVDEANAAATYDYKGVTYYFCSTACKRAFEKGPERGRLSLMLDRVATRVREMW